MSVSNGVQEFIYTSLAENNKALLDQISKLVADSAESIKRFSVEAAHDQLTEIKKLRREEPKSFKRKGNEIQHSLILSYRIPWMRLIPTLSPTQLTRLNPPCQKVRQCYLRGKSLFY